MAPGSSKRPRVLPGQTRLPVEKVTKKPRIIKPRLRPKSAPTKTKYGQPNPISALRFHDASIRGARALPVPGVSGAFVTTPCVARNVLPTPTSGGPTYVICHWTPNHRRGWIIQSNNVAGAFLGLNHLSEAGPSSIRPLCATLKMRNYTESDKISGIVRVLMLSEPLDWEFSDLNTAELSTNFVNELSNMMSSHPGVKSYSGASFQTGKKFVFHPTSLTQFKLYEPYDVSTTNADLCTMIKNAGTLNPMSTLILQFGATSNANSYDISLHTQDATRFPANTMYSQLAEIPPSVDEQTFAAGSKEVQKQAGQAHPDVQMGPS